MSHCSRHDVPMLPGALGCPACAAEPLTMVCPGWGSPAARVHSEPRHMSGPAIGSGAPESHGACDDCAQVIRREWGLEAEEMRAARERARGGVE